MLTTRQQESFQKLKEGRLTTKQKADFYYRVSNILKDDLESIDDQIRLLEDLPNSYLEKIDFRKATLSAMKLTEMLLKKLDPTPVSVSEDGAYQAVSYFAARNIFPDLPDTTINFKAVSEPTKEEIDFFNKLKWHAKGLNALTETGGKHALSVYGPDQINEEFVSMVLCEGKPCKVEICPEPIPVKSSDVTYPLLGNFL